MNVLLSCWLALAPATPDASPLEAAERAFASGNYDDAAGRFAALYEDSGDPAHRYQEAQALRLAGRHAEAAEAYEAFISQSNARLSDLDPTTRNQVMLMIGNAEVQARSCRDMAPPQPEPEPRPEPEPVPPPEPEPPPPAVDEPEPIARPDTPPRRLDPLEFSLWTSGALVTAAGIGLSATAAFRADAAPRTSHDAWLERQQGARAQQAVGFAVVGVGGALLVGAIVRSVTLRRRSSRSVALSW